MRVELAQETLRLIKHYRDQGVIGIDISDDALLGKQHKTSGKQVQFLTLSITLFIYLSVYRSICLSIYLSPKSPR
jgi:hypothetical protein